MWSLPSLPAWHPMGRTLVEEGEVGFCVSLFFADFIPLVAAKSRASPRGVWITSLGGRIRVLARGSPRTSLQACPGSRGSPFLPLHGDWPVQAPRHGAGLLHLDLAAQGTTGRPLTSEHPGPLPLQDSPERAPSQDSGLESSVPFSSPTFATRSLCELSCCTFLGLSFPL